jgi:hypothetical protein
LGPAVAYTGLYPQNCNLSVSSRKVSAGYHSAFSAARRFFHPTIRLTVDAHRAAMVDGGSPVPIAQAVPRALTSRSSGRLVDSVRNLIARCCRLLGLVPTDRLLVHPSGEVGDTLGPCGGTGSARRLYRNNSPPS